MRNLPPSALRLCSFDSSPGHYQFISAFFKFEIRDSETF